MLPKPENYDEMIRKYRRGEVGERSNLPEEIRKYDAYLRYIKNNPDHPEILDIDNEEEFMRYKHELRIQRISEKQQLTWANPAYKKLRSLMTINQHKKETKEDYDSRISKQRETWANKSDEEKLAHSEHTRNQWANYTDEEKKIINDKHSKTISTTKYKALFRKNSLNYWNELPKERQDEIINNLRGALNEWRNNLTEEDKLKLSAQRSIISKSIWANIPAEERHNIAIRSRDTFMSKPESEILAAHRKIGESRKNIWDNMSDEEKNEVLDRLFNGNQLYWSNMSNEERARVSEIHSINSKKYIESLSEEERARRQERLYAARKSWWESLPATEKELYSLRGQERWANMNTDTKESIIRRQLLAANGRNKFHLKFEDAFNKHLSDYFYFISEYPTTNNNVTHCWDYAIFDQNGELECLVDLDGAYYHADNCEYDGVHSHKHYDERRPLTIPDETKWCIIYELQFDKSFKYLLSILSLTYNELIDRRFKEYRMMPFPYPEYTTKELYKSYNGLLKMKYFDKYHSTLSMDIEIGNRILLTFHYSIFHARIGTHESPHDIWKNDVQLRDMIYNHELLHNYINKNKILQGFNLKYRVPFMSSGIAKMVIEKYIFEYDEIFDPFSEFSGRLLGAISLGKKYIGQDISEIHVRESNQILDWLHENMYEFDAKVTCADSYKTKGTYQCLFTSLPRIGESYEDVDETKLSCDEWIDACLNNYQCSKYVFVVDDTVKYRDYIVDNIYSDKVLSLQSLGSDINAIGLTNDKTNAVPRLQQVKQYAFDENY